MENSHNHKIRALVMDIDGTMTDGGIYIGETGEIMKRFYVRDGLAIKHILPKYGIIPIVITGRSSEIVKRRCEELDIHDVIQGSDNKLSELKRILLEKKISLEETAYIGDDINDLECMNAVYICGCPADAVKQVRDISDFVSASNGGQGAIREFVEWLIIGDI